MTNKKIILSGIIALVIVFSMISLPATTFAKHELCTFSHKGDTCYGHDTSKFPKLPRGQHYGQCEEVGNNHELGCDIDYDGEGSDQ